MKNINKQLKLSYGKLIKEGELSKLAIADLVEIAPKKYLITRLNVPEGHRGKGIGTELLNEITNDADKECSTLLIEPSPYGERTRVKTKKLVKFYEKFGFDYISKDEYMKREPKCKK